MADNVGDKGLEFKRAVAYKISIKNILEASYIKSDQSPNFLLTKNGQKMFRINLIAILVEKLSEDMWILEDGTGRITLRSFNNMPQGFSNGDLILVIGKPRETYSEKYLIPEIIKKLDSYSWLNLRNIELKNNYNVMSNYQDVKLHGESLVNDENLKVVEGVYEMIKNLDKGSGVDFSFLVKSLGENAENIISKLLERGEIFEIKPGKLKVLE